MVRMGHNEEFWNLSPLERKIGTKFVEDVQQNTSMK